MEQDIKKITETYNRLLNTYQFFPVYNYNTNDYFLDKNNNTYFFAAQKDIDNFINELQPQINVIHTKYPERLMLKDLLSNLHSIGAEKANFKVINSNNKIISLPVEIPIDYLKVHYNQSAKHNSLLLKETHKKKYITALQSNFLICAALIPDRKEQEYPIVKYAYAIINNQKYYLLFTSLPEFEKWNKNQDINYLPIKTSFEDFSIITKSAGFFIDSYTTMLILDNKYLQST